MYFHEIFFIFTCFDIYFCSINYYDFSDTLERIIENKISSGLTSVGNKIAEIIPGEGDTEVTISEQDNYDIKFSILAVRPIVKNPYSGLNNEHLYFTQLAFKQS